MSPRVPGMTSQRKRRGGNAGGVMGTGTGQPRRGSGRCVATSAGRRAASPGPGNRFVQPVPQQVFACDNALQTMGRGFLCVSRAWQRGGERMHVFGHGAREQRGCRQSRGMRAVGRATTRACGSSTPTPRGSPGGPPPHERAARAPTPATHLDAVVFVHHDQVAQAHVAEKNVGAFQRKGFGHLAASGQGTVGARRRKPLMRIPTLTLGAPLSCRPGPLPSPPHRECRKVYVWREVQRLVPQAGGGLEVG